MFLIGTCRLDYVIVSTKDNHHLLTSEFLLHDESNEISTCKYKRTRRDGNSLDNIQEEKNKTDKTLKLFQGPENAQLQEDMLRNAINRLFDKYKVNFSVKNIYFTPTDDNVDHVNTQRSKLFDYSTDEYNPEDMVAYHFCFTLEEAFYLAAELNLLNIRYDEENQFRDMFLKEETILSEVSVSCTGSGSEGIVYSKQSSDKDNNTKFYSISSLWHIFTENKNFRRRYFCHRFYRQKKFLVGTAFQHGADFSLYVGKKENYHAKYLVYIYSNICCSKIYLRNTFFCENEHPSQINRNDVETEKEEEDLQLLNWPWTYADTLSRNAQDVNKLTLLVSVSEKKRKAVVSDGFFNSSISCEFESQQEENNDNSRTESKIDTLIQINDMVLASKNPKQIKT